MTREPAAQRRWNDGLFVGIRVVASVVCIVGLAAVPVWSASKLAKARALGESNAREIDIILNAYRDVVCAERDGEIESLMHSVEMFNRRIPVGQHVHQLQVQLMDIFQTAGCTMENLRFLPPEPANIEGAGNYYKLPIQLESNGTPAGTGRIIDALASSERGIWLHGLRLTAGAPERANDSVRIRCLIDASVFYRQESELQSTK